MGSFPVQVEVQRVMTPKEASALVGSKVPKLEATIREETIGYDADTHEPIFAYLDLGERAERLREAVLSFEYDGTTARAGGFENKSRTFGYAPRRPVYGREGCRPARLVNESPRSHLVLEEWADVLTERLAQVDPRLISDGKTETSIVEPSWRLGEQSFWTSGVINKSSRLPYHRDGFNFHAWSVMPVFRRNMRGGFLSIPEYGLTVPCRDRWALCFPGWQLVHGVTEMKESKPGGYRYSVVYYSLKGMKDCQPTGTPVRVPVSIPRGEGGGKGRQRADFTEVPIETLSAGDKVVTWYPQSSELRSRGREIIRAGSRPYEGPLVTVEAGGHSSRYTPEHHCLVRLDAPAPDDGEFLVYLMQRGDQYRIGRTRWGRRGSNFRQRLQQEDVDAAWILSAHQTLAEAGLTEAVAAATYGLPGISFVEEKHYAFSLSTFWDKIGTNRAQAEACLSHFGRLIDRPLLRRPEQAGKSWTPAEGVAAANLMSGMLLPVANEPLVTAKNWQRWTAKWEPAKVGSEFYTGLVHSLEVDQDHNYIADGIITHNCFTAAKELEYSTARRSERERQMAEGFKNGQGFPGRSMKKQTGRMMGGKSGIELGN